MWEREESEKARKGRKERGRHIRSMSTNHTFGDKGLPDSLPAFQAPGRKLYQLLLILLSALDMAQIKRLPSLDLYCSLDTPLSHLQPLFKMLLPPEVSSTPTASLSDEHWRALSSSLLAGILPSDNLQHNRCPLACHATPLSCICVQTHLSCPE